MKPLARALVGGLLIASTIGVLGFGLTRDPKVLRGELVGRPAPAFDLLGLDGRRVRLRRPPRRPMVINFWASWCTECRKEHPDLMRAHDRWQRRVDFVGIVFRDAPRNVERFLLERGETPATTYPNLIDEAARTAIDYGVYGVPETFFVDRRGIVVYKRIGRVTPELLRDQIARIAS